MEQIKRVYISTSNSKLGPIPSINLPAIKTCRQNAPCSDLCYAMHGRFNFKSVKAPIETNYDIWINDPESYEIGVISRAYFASHFRFHSSGDIPDEKYLEMMVRIAEKCKQTSFLCFTKKFELINNYISCGKEMPNNLHIVFSAWGDKFVPDNPYHFPIAYVKFKEGDTTIPADAAKCRGYCGECVMTGNSCWDLGKGQSVYFCEH